MTTEYITFVSVSTVLGTLRWIAAILFVLFVIFMLIRQVKTKKSFAFVASFISALAIVPFLVLTPVTLTIEQGTTPEPTPVNPIPNKDPEPEPQPEPEPINPIEPVKPSGNTPSYQPPVAPEQPETPSEPIEPEEPEVTATYKVIHRQQNLDNDEYSAIESETKTGIVGKSVTPDTKSYTGFVAPAKKTVTLAESGTEVIYDYKRAMIAFSIEDDEYVISSLPEDNYKYGTEVTLTAKDRDGYTFDHWNNESSSTENPATIAIESATPIKPIYTPNSYRVVFYKNDDAATGSMAAQTLTYDESTPLNANTFTLAGYSFDHWGDNDADTGARYTNQQSVKNLATEGDFALYAFWTANNDTPYTVNHYKMKVNGTGYELAESEPKTGTTDTMVTPDRKSYTGFTAPAAESKKITGDGEMHIDYYYSRNQYTITFTENAANITSDTFTSGEKYYYEQSGNLTASDKTGYRFENWTDGSTNTTRSFTMGAANAEIGAEYRANTYTVIFHANYQSSSATATQSFTYDQALTALSANSFNRAGYDFAHWNTKANDSGDNYANQAEVQNLTAEDGGEFHLYAQWTPRDDTHYIVHHQLMTIDGQGYGRGVDEDKYGTSDTEVTPAVKSFNGFDAPQPQTITIAADGSTEVYYNYDRQKRTLTIEDAEFVETTTPSDEYYFNTYITLKAKDREGYTFVRWSNREDNTNQTYSFNLSDDTTIRPIYEANTYKIVFHKNTGEDPEVTAEQSRTYGDPLPFTLEANTFTNGDYNFLGWATEATGAVAYEDQASLDADLSTENDVNLYAVWQLQYTVSFDVNGGTSAKPDDIIVEAGSTVPQIPADARWSGYGFNGWYTSDDVKLTNTTVINGDTVFYAHWLKYIDENVVSTTPITITKGQTYTLPILKTYNDWPVEDLRFVKYDMDIISLKGSKLQITGLAAGETQLWVDGTKSNNRMIMPITVNELMRTVSFNAHGGTTPDSIQVADDTITPSAQIPSSTLQGYDLAGWWTGETDGTSITETTITDDITFHARWTPRTDTPYTIIHRQQNIENDDYTIADTDELTGTTGTTVPAAVKDYAGFTAPTATTIEILADGSASLTYDYDRVTVAFTITDSEYVTSTIASGASYKYGVQATLTANAKEGYTFAHWSDANESTANPITITLTSDTTIGPVYTASTYNVVFHSNVPGNDQTSTQSFTYDDAYKALAANEFTYTGYEFDKWTTNADGTGDTYDDEETVRNLTTSGDFPLYAQWIESTQPVYVCRKATSLHVSPLGYFGQLPDDNDPKRAGDAYDCQVSDTVTQRFYYIGKKNGNAIMFSSEGIDHTQIYQYAPSLDYLYTSSDWNNDKLVVFENDKVTRYLTRQEVIQACPTATVKNGLLDCEYFLEGTSYDPNSNGGRSAYWLEKEGDKLYRIHKDNKYIVDAASNANSVVRPAIEVPFENVEGLDSLPKYTITFNSKGGSTVVDKEVEIKDPIGTLETPEYLGYSFEGWYADEQYAQAVTADYIPESDMELFAKWAQTNVAAITDGATYETLQLAINAVPISGERTEVTLIKNVSEKLEVKDGRYVYLTIGNNVISNSGSNNVFNVNENSTLEIHDGTIQSSTSQGAINVNKKGKLIVTGGKINATGSKQAIYTKGGDTTISGNPIITATSSDRAAVHVLNDGSTVGTTTILGGTIVSTNFNAVYAESGTLVIGAENSQADTDTPIMTGKKFGIASNVSYSFYGGKAMGETFSIGSSNTASDTTHSRISNIETGFSLIDGEETEGSTTYKTLYLGNIAPTQSNITFNANGGTIIGQSSKVVATNEPLSILPDATYAKHAFLGWFDGYGNEVDETTIPDGDTEYIAHWQNVSSSDIDYYNIQSSAVTRYMANINSWKAPEETLLAELRDNFNFYNCKISANEDISGSFSAEYRYTTTGTNLCDQPRGYDTGVNGAIAVYQSSESQKEKGAHVAYLDSTDGVIVNMIPNQTYYWESASNPDEHGYVKAIGERRLIALPSTRNARDIGGLAAADGKTIKYGIIMRGEELASAADVTVLGDLGITQEYDVRTSGKNGSHFAAGHYRTNVGMHNYDIMYSNKPDYYAEARNALTQLMTDIAAGESVYIHCSHGVDRAGTLVYLAEMLLGVSEADIDIDYELSSFSGRADRTRYYRHKDGNSSEFNPDRKYEYLKQNLGSYQEVYNWFIDQSTDPVADAQLIDDFRAAALE